MLCLANYLPIMLTTKPSIAFKTLCFSVNKINHFAKLYQTQSWSILNLKFLTEGPKTPHWGSNPGPSNCKVTLLLLTFYCIIAYFLCVKLK